MILGRNRELERLHGLIDGISRGDGESAVIRGAAGIGKTVLLDAACAAADAAGLTVLRARGVQSEADLSFAGLADLLMPLVDELDSLPGPQAAALKGALAIGPPVPGDRLAVGVATVGVLTEVARQTPVVVMVDDFQWLDGPSRECVLFAARRAGRGIGCILVERTEPDSPMLAADLPALAVEPLSHDDSHALLSRVAGDLDAGVSDLIVAAAAGNPLALVDLPAQLTEDQRRGQSPLRTPLPQGGAIERLYASRIDALPEQARLALAIAAAYEADDVRTIALACRELGADADDLAVAEDAELVTLADARIAFAHPLARAAAYHAVSARDRRSVHRALAAVTAAAARAWHLAAAAIGPDEEAATALEAAARTAGARRAYASAADALARAADLSEDTQAAMGRLVGAGAAALSAGRPEQAARVLDAASDRAADPGLRAAAQHLRGVVDVWNGNAREAVERLRNEADSVAGFAPRLAALMLADAAVAATMEGDPPSALADAERARELLGDDPDPAARAQVLSVLSWSLVLRGNSPRAREILDDLELLAPSIDPLSPAAQSLMLGVNARLPTEDFERAHRDAMAMANTAREAGALFALGVPLLVAGDAAYRLGWWDDLDAHLEETMELGAVTGQHTSSAHAAVLRARLAAARGQVDLCRALTAGAVLDADLAEAHSGHVFVHAALGFMELGLGRIDEAIVELDKTEELIHATGNRDPSLIPWAPDLFDAYLRAGRSADADRVCSWLEDAAARTGTHWPAAAAARCRGSLADDFDPLFETALAHHDEVPMPFERARTLLSWGARLHRARRRVQARERLREALEIFRDLDAPPWAAQAESELRAAGARHRSQRQTDSLSSQEIRVASAAARGATTKEIAAEMYLSPKTIEFHLGRVYRKLGVSNRAELASELARNESNGSVVHVTD